MWYIKMPYAVEKNRDGTYKVINKNTGKVHAYHTTLEKAKAQIRLMEAADAKPKARQHKLIAEKRKPRESEPKMNYM